MRPKLLVLIVVLMGIAAFILATVGLVQVGHPLNPNVAYILAISAAAEAYKTDTGHYPSDPATTDQLNPSKTFDSEAYIASSASLYHALAEGGKNYLKGFDLPKKQLKTNKGGITYLVDSRGNSLGYSTFKAAHPEGRDGYNPTFDLWSTGGGKSDQDTAKRIRNW